MTNSETQQKRPQDGPKEYLLCKECEQRFGRFERYYKHKTESSGIFDMIDISNFFAINDFDYKKIKLFFLSILWRMSVTSIEGFHIELGTTEKEKIRIALLNDCPMDPYMFAVLPIIPVFQNQPFVSLLMNPKVINEPFNKTVIILLNGLLYWISLDSEKSPFPKEAIINKVLWTFCVTEIRNFPFLHDILTNVEEI
jgi:hypothetical protein